MSIPATPGKYTDNYVIAKFLFSMLLSVFHYRMISTFCVAWNQGDSSKMILYDNVCGGKNKNRVAD